MDSAHLADFFSRGTETAKADRCHTWVKQVPHNHWKGIDFNNWVNTACPFDDQDRADQLVRAEKEEAIGKTFEDQLTMDNRSVLDIRGCHSDPDVH